MMADIDECAGSNKCGCQYNDGICKSTCTNTDGSYNCQCSKGYYKNSAELCEGMFHRFFLQDYGLMRSKPLRGIKVLTTEFLFLLDSVSSKKRNSVVKTFIPLSGLLLIRP